MYARMRNAFFALMRRCRSILLHGRQPTRVATANTPHMASMNMLRMDRCVSSDHSVSQESEHVVRSKTALAWGVRLLNMSLDPVALCSC
jgi:hypothetical protein